MCHIHVGQGPVKYHVDITFWHSNQLVFVESNISLQWYLRIISSILYVALKARLIQAEAMEVMISGGTAISDLAQISLQTYAQLTCVIGNHHVSLENLYIYHNNKFCIFLLVMQDERLGTIY